jgi:hypothetical protein
METEMNEKSVVKTRNMNDILFPVEKVSTELITNMPANSNCEYSIIVNPFGEDSKRHVSFCSERYELVPLASFLPAIRQILIDKGLKFTEKYTMHDYSVFNCEFVIEDTDFYIGDTPADKLLMRINVAHSYNGQQQYGIDMGTAFRKKCTNGLWLTVMDSVKYGLSIRGKHTAKINKSLYALTEKLELVLNNDVKAKFKETFNPLYDHWVANWEDRLLEVLTTAGIGTKKTNIEHISNIIKSESLDLYGGRVNDWLIYNGVNNFIFDNDKNVKINADRVKLDNKVLQAIQTTIN